MSVFILPDLPYAYDALEPVISAETFRFHHDKHHAAYVKTTNDLLAKSDTQYDNLESVIADAARADDTKLFNAAAQAWNHGFFWAAMSPNHEQPSGDLEVAIKAAFGDLTSFKAAFTAAGVAQFGSGWVWLVADLSGKVQVISTHDAGTPLTHPGLTPLLVCDVWEHAYYIDHRNDRKAYLEAWFDAVPNWGFAASQFAGSRAEGSRWGYPAPSRSVAAE